MSDQSNPLVDKELEILKFWQDNRIFEKSLEQTSKNEVYSFYDGPPFATGTPHYGHLVASIMKDVVPRYQTMKGYYVERKWGWDCHGLPIENIVEKELGFHNKQDIVNFGIDKFNETCRSKVLAYTEEWKKTIGRLGRWADMDDPYKTMDLEYMESVWWTFKELWDRGLIYQGYKSMHVCPRCETTLSQQEVSEGYKDIKDISATSKFELIDEPKTFVLAWTTTPWTLPGNVALAVGAEIEYSQVKIGDEQYILASNLMDKVLPDTDYEIVKTLKGQYLVGKKYQPLFPYYQNVAMKNQENLYTIVAADFVSTDDGTGVVHIAPAFGEEDMILGQEANLPMIQHLDINGVIKDEVVDFKGMNVKPIDDTQKTDVEVIKYLADKQLLFAKEKFEHSYPHCWRCDTPLINYATSSWFVKVTEVKDKALEEAKSINWSPKHIKAGRFGKWLEGARDWSISRQRFWASVMPIWECECGERKVIGSVKELEDLSGQKVTDIHKHIVDKIQIPCSKCDKQMSRIPDVLDTWFDSGSMPYAQHHYPFENKELVDDNFPAEFIAEGADQTRAWFYYLHIIATAIKEKPAYRNVIVNGIVLAEDGKKMSKKLQNYPEPDIIMDKYGADALRFYLLSSPVMAAENLNFSEDGVKEAYQKVVMLTNNILKFYKLYESKEIDISQLESSENILDQWLVVKLNLLIRDVSTAMDSYILAKAVRPIQEFVDEFSTWWLRRSRDRFKSEAEKKQALTTFGYILVELSKVMAPFLPFLAESVYKDVSGVKESVHLEAWPVYNEDMVDSKLLDKMDQARKVVELGLAARAEKNIKIRQPLNKLAVFGYELEESLADLIQDEVNVKEVTFEKASEIKVELDTEMTEELKVDGALRELIRTVNNIRKNQGLTLTDKIKVRWMSDGEIIHKVMEGRVEDLKTATLTSEVIREAVQGKETNVNGERIILSIEKI